MTLKEKIRKIWLCMKDDRESFESEEEAVAFLNHTLMRFPAYLDVVVAMEAKVPVLKLMYEEKAYQEAYEALDYDRSMAHGAAIRALTTLNRYCINHGLEKISDADTDDRVAVAGFWREFVLELFDGRKL